MTKHLLNILFAIFILLSCKGQPPKKGYKAISIDTFKNEVIGKDVQLIDTRTQLEYNNGYIDDAINMNILDRKKFKEQVEKLDKNKPVYLYCLSGKRSYYASKLIQNLGFKIVYDYSGGWSEWSKQLEKK